MIKTRTQPNRDKQGNAISERRSHLDGERATLFYDN